MRAARIAALGATPELTEAEEPARAQGQALVEVAAVGLNPVEISISTGRFYGGPPPLPYIPGSEAAGRVLEGESLPAGTRVYVSGDGLGVARDGTYAERVAAAERMVFPLPDGLDDATAVACGIAGLAGWVPVSWRAGVGAGDRVLVLGGTGTVGLTAVQGARVLGAERVVAAGRRREALARAEELGADAVVPLEGRSRADLVEAFREACGGDGPTVVIDPLWGEPLAAAVDAAARGARIVQIGQSAGAEATLLSNSVRGKQLEIYGYSNFYVPPDVYRDAYRSLAEHAAAGRIAFDVETYPFERVAEAWQRQVGGPGTKLVVTL